MLPVEQTIGSPHILHFQETSNEKNLRLNFYIIKERIEKSNIHQAAYKSALERHYN